MNGCTLRRRRQLVELVPDGCHFLCENGALVLMCIGTDGKNQLGESSCYRGCSSVVERMLRMYEAPGSIPGISIGRF